MGAEQSPGPDRLDQGQGLQEQLEESSSRKVQTADIAEAFANPDPGGLAQLLQAWYTRLSEHYGEQGMEEEARVFGEVADEFGGYAQRYRELGGNLPASGAIGASGGAKDVNLDGRPKGCK